MKPLVLALAALAVVGCTRATATSGPPPRADETCARLGALYAKEGLPYEKGECMRMVGALLPDDASCFDHCTQGPTVKALLACQVDCRNAKP